MRRCKMFCFVLLLPLFLLTNFSNVSIKAAAAFSGGRFMTPSESLDVFGSTIDFQYYDGTGYTTSTFRYNGSVNVWGVDNSGEFSSDLTSYTYLRYISDTVTGVNYDHNYITVDISPSYSIFDTEQIHSCIALSTSSPVSTVFQSPAWDWVIGGQSIHAENSVESSSGSGVFAGIELYSVKHTFVPFDWSSQALSSGYSLRATFCGNNPSNGTYFLLIACPYVSTQSEGSNGTFTQTSGTGDINVNVDVDLTETNGILSAIQGVLSGIVDGVKGLFIPSQNALSTFVNAVDTLLHETFGIFYDNETLIHSALTQLLTGSAQESIYFEGFTMSLAGTSFTFPSFNVPLKPDNAHMSLLYTALASAIDIVCTLAFINMLKHKIWAVFMGEKIVEVEELDDAD